jgi:phosphoribosylformimino-5-aminoimidazole carboxamide ribotide isomerase
MNIIPAIDIKDGRCVRLRQGLAEAVTVYADDPVAMARHWVKEGAESLHVVDLDGAFEGRPVHQDIVARIVAAAGIPVQCGGGLRTDEDIRTMLAAGVARVVLGTRACAHPEELKRLAKLFGGQIAVGIDARNGKVQVRGWVELTDKDALSLAVDVADTGVRTIVYTDTTTDGMLVGPNVQGVLELCEMVDCDVIASGGVASVQDVASLRELEQPNLRGVIVGKALYEEHVTLAELNHAARE